MSNTFGLVVRRRTTSTTPATTRQERTAFSRRLFSFHQRQPGRRPVLGFLGLWSVPALRSRATLGRRRRGLSFENPPFAKPRSGWAPTLSFTMIENDGASQQAIPR